MVSEARQGFDEATVAGLAVEYWKLVRTSVKMAGMLSEAEARRFEGQLRFSARQLEVIMAGLGARLVEFDGEPYEDGIAAAADNSDEFDPGAALVVERTLEPAVVRDMRVLRRGRVLVSAAGTGEGQGEGPGQGEGLS